MEMEVTKQTDVDQMMRGLEQTMRGIEQTVQALQVMAETMAKSSGEPPVDKAPIVAEAKEEDRFLRGYEAICNYLKISQTTLWRLKKAKKIPIIQRGKMVYCDKREIDKVYFRR